MQITQKVFDKCGTPRLNKRSATGNPDDFNTVQVNTNNIRKIMFGNVQDFRFDDEHDEDSTSELSRVESVKHVRRSTNNAQRFFNNKFTRSWDVASHRKQPEKSEFETVIQDIRRSVRSSQGFWRHLPYSLCASSQETLFSRVLRESRNIEIKEENLKNGKHGMLSTRVQDSSSNDMDNTSKEKLCWNGKDSVYDSSITAEGLTNPAQHSDVSLNAIVPPDEVKEQIHRLQTITNQLKQAHRGHDVEWWDNDEDSDDDDIGVMNDGSGDNQHEGSGNEWPQDDDEDHYPAGSGGGSTGQASAGSGCGDDEDCNWPIPPSPGPWVPYPNKEDPIATTVDPSTIGKENIPPGSGSGSFRVRRWNTKHPLEMLVTISRFLVPQFAIGLGWYITNGITGISIYPSRTQTAL